WSLLGLPSDAGASERELALSRECGRFDGDAVRRHKGGSRLNVHLTIVPLASEGAPRGYGGVTRKLVVSAEARTFIDGVQDYAIFRLDPDGIVASWNAGAERIKGYTAEEIIGRSFTTFYPPEEVAAKKCEMELERARIDGRFEDEGYRV